MSRTFERLSSLLRRPGARRTLFVLAPIAYALALLIEPRVQPPAQVGFRLGRSEALLRAREYLASRGFPTEGWSSNVSATVQDEVVSYLADISPGERATLSRLDPGVFLRVSLWNASKGSLAQVWLSSRAEVIRWTTRNKNEKAPATAADADRVVAERALAAQFGNRGTGAWTFQRIAEETNDAAHLRKFVWTAPAGKAAAEATIEIRGGRVTGEMLHLQPPPVTTWQSRSMRLATIIRSTVGVVLAVLAIVALLVGAFRWLTRMREHEVSHGRAAGLAAVVFLGFMPSALIGMYTGQLDQSVAPDTTMLVSTAILASVLFGGFSLLCGLAWAGGEGDLRRMFPAKLSSADALLSGRVASRNVGRSLLVGLAIAGIGAAAMVSAQLVAVSLAPVRLAVTRNQVFLLAAPLPWLFVPSADMMGTILTIMAGFVIGLPLLGRATHDQKRALLLLAVPLTVVGLSELPAAGGAAIVASIVAGLAYAGMQLIAFTAGDLVAAAATVVAIGLTRAAGLFLAQPNAEMRGAGISLLVVLAGLVLFAVVAAWRGREWSAEELLPAYARRIAINEEMRAEMDLARRAQTALLSRAAVGTAGVAIATEVVPASTVGGDYVDAFERGGGGLLWIVADGGGHGAGAALAMTLTRGLLLALSRGTLGAAEIARRVEQHLRRELGDEAVPRFAIGTWAESSNAIAIARNGGYPKAAFRPSNGPSRPLAFVAAENNLETADAALAAGEGVLVWTDGVEALPDVWGAPFGEQRLLEASDSAPRGAGRWSESLRARFVRHGGVLTAGRLADDLALLVMTRDGGAA